MPHNEQVMHSADSRHWAGVLVPVNVSGTYHGEGGEEERVSEMLVL